MTPHNGEDAPPDFAPPALGFRWNRADGAQFPLALGVTLASGQSFRWRQDAQGVWWGALAHTVVAAWQPEPARDRAFCWQTFPVADQWEVVADYFRLAVPLDALYADWRRAEPRIAPALVAYRGLRILRQPPEECFFAFQCATCNTVTKIERSVHRLAARYGEPLRTGLTDPPFPFYAFPTLDVLAQADETVLRADLWGYRAPRVIGLARALQSRPDGWLTALRLAPYPDAKSALTALHGIGAKLADCICLFALDKDAAVPVDTHVRQIATRLFRPDLTGKSLTPRVYDALAQSYRERFGGWAGWAQQYLFFSELHRAPDYACPE